MEFLAVPNFGKPMQPDSKNGNLVLPHYANYANKIYRPIHPNEMTG